MSSKKPLSSTIFSHLLSLCFLISCITESQAQPISKIENLLRDILKRDIPSEEPPNNGLDGMIFRRDIDLTRQAVMKFQRFYGLNQTGVLDIDTLQQMSNPKCECKTEDTSLLTEHDKEAMTQQSNTKGRSMVSISDEIESEEPLTPPDICIDASINTVTRTADGNTYMFKGEMYWRLISPRGIAYGYPKPISENWNGLPGNLDASLTWSNGRTFFFKGEHYWRFTNKKMDSGYPKLIKVGFSGIPDNLDAAFVWSGDDKTYFFKGDKYWKFDSRLTPPVNSSLPISHWKGLPNNLTAAFQYDGKMTYFFKDDVYYRLDDQEVKVAVLDPPYPRPTSTWWFDCKNPTSD